MKRIALCLATIIALNSATFGDALPSRSFEFTYKVAVESLPATAHSVKVWVPVPQSTDYQTITNLRVEGAQKHRFVVEPTFGNKVLLVDVKPGVTHTTFEIVLDATREQRRNLDGNAQAVATALEDMDQYLTPTSMMKTDGPIAEEARRVVGATENPLVQARKLYDHIVDTVEYDKSGDGWGRGDAAYACDVRKGNCTDFHSLFIGEAISLGVPSRFLMGFSIPTDAPEGAIGGYHCWAEFFVEDRGWLPVDASEAFKDPARRDELFGGLDEHRIQFTMGRDISLPEMQGNPLNYSIYPYAEVDGRQHDAIQTRFSYRDRD